MQSLGDGYDVAELLDYCSGKGILELDCSAGLVFVHRRSVVRPHSPAPDTSTFILHPSQVATGLTTLFA